MTRIIVALLLPATTVWAAPQESGVPVRSAEALTGVFIVRRKHTHYKAMEGPVSIQKIGLQEDGSPELLWMTGYKSVMVGPDGNKPMLQEFLCHSNLDLDPRRYQERLGWNKRMGQRLFTLAQGQHEIRFPEGFGLPIISNEPLVMTSQSLSHELEGVEGEVFHIRHKVTVDFIRDRDLVAPMKPLFMVAATGMKLLEGADGYYGVKQADPEKHGPGCSMGDTAGGVLSFNAIKTDKYGRKFTGHWLVKPGREVNHTLVTRYMNLPFDTTLHYIALHLHPFAESMELRDITSGTTLFKSNVYNLRDRVGIERVDYFSSEEGIPLYKSHEYEVISVYNNTTDQDQTSMAVMFLYLLDKEFQKPDVAATGLVKRTVEPEVTRSGVGRDGTGAAAVVEIRGELIRH